MSSKLHHAWASVSKSRVRAKLLETRGSRRRRTELTFIRLEERTLLTSMGPVTPTLATVAISSSSTIYGQSETLTATVTTSPPSGTTPSGGLVTFLDGATTLGTATLGSSGTASLTTGLLVAGAHTISATYAGGVGFGPSDSTTTPAIIINTVAGVSNPYAIGGTPTSALASGLNAPQAVSVDSAGDLFITDQLDSVILEVAHATHLVSIVAGTFGVSGYSGDGGSATSASMAGANDVAVDASGNLFIADYYNNVIREVNHATGVITTVAGDNGQGDAGDGGLATDAELNLPSGVAVDTSGHIFVADSNNNVIREFTVGGDITTVAGNGTSGFSGDGGLATSAQLDSPQAIALDSADDIFIADNDNNRIREVTHATGQIITVAGNGTPGSTGNGAAATSAEIGNIFGIAIDSSSHLFITDVSSNTVREFTPGGNITTVAGNGTAGSSGNGGLATSAEFNNCSNLAVDSSGNIYVADTSNDVIREFTVGGNISIAVGTGSFGYNGDSELATSAQLSDPAAVVVDSAGDIFIADTRNSRVREINHSTGDISTIAGIGTSGFAGDGGLATSAELSNPSGLALDSSGDLFITDSGNDVIREVIHSSGDIITVAGIGGDEGYSGNGGLATAATLSFPGALWIDSSANLFIADTQNNVIREVDHTTGDISTIAGNGTYGDSGDGGLATSAGLQSPDGVAVDSAGNVYIADSQSSVVREVNHSTGIITTIAGTGTFGYSGDGGLATSAELGSPRGLAFDSAGDLLIADSAPNSTIREIDLSTNIISTVAGTGTAGFSGNGSTPTSAALNNPAAVTVNSAGVIFVADSGNNQIREILTTVNPAPTVTVSPAILTLTPNPLTKLYGAPVPTPTTFSITGFVNGDSTSVVTGTDSDFSVGATAASSVSGSPYPIILNDAGTLRALNYIFHTVSGVLTITPAPLTISANSQTSVSGQPIPLFTASYSGFVNHDTLASLVAFPILYTSATTSSSPGVYPIYVSRAASLNYAITFVNGSLTLTAPQSVAPPPVTVPLVTVQNVTIQTQRVGKKKTQTIVIQFSASLNAAGAGSLANYSLATVPQGKKHKTKIVAIGTATYNSTQDTVTLSTRAKLVLNPPLQLIVNASGLLDSLGRSIDGTDSGQAGTNFRAIISASGAVADVAISSHNHR